MKSGLDSSVRVREIQAARKRYHSRQRPIWGQRNGTRKDLSPVKAFQEAFILGSPAAAAEGTTLFGRWFGQRDWCCEAFRALHEARYDRDLFVFVRPPGWAMNCPAPTFWLAFRSVRHQDRTRPVQGLPPDRPLTISTSRRILRCPWCGVELERHYQKQWEKLFDPAIFQEFELPVTNECNKQEQDDLH